MTRSSQMLYVDGEWRHSDGAETTIVKNPADEETVGEVPNATDSEVEMAVNAAQDAQDNWESCPAKEREQLVEGIARVLYDNTTELAEYIVAEQGKPFQAARGEVESAAELAAYTAGWARRVEGDILPADERNEAIHIQRHPVGVVAGIVPWNFPIAVFVRKLAPALITGNTVVMKPSEVTPFADLYLTELIDEELEFPDGVINVVTGNGAVGEHLVTAKGVDMVTMTGNVKTGKEIMRTAADDLTRVSLELGGKAPAIVWRDADIDAAVRDILTARVTNTGQVCTCAERVYVHADVQEEFTNRYVAATERLTLGDPMDNPDMGPHVSARELEKTADAVAGAIDAGAQVLTGGNRSEDFDVGYWYEPTVLSNVNNDMSVMHREVFGPVTPIMEINSFDEAITLANDSRYGLSSYLFTNNYNLVMRAAEELEFGETYINRTLGEARQGHHIGWNESGIGGEDGKYGVQKYTQLKTIYHNFD